jgi:hypothetical protein
MDRLGTQPLTDRPQLGLPAMITMARSGASEA